jgi:AraC-like DNA-binding protein
MGTNCLQETLTRLGKAFDEIDWKYLEVPAGSPREKTQLWPGDESEEIMICVYKGKHINQLFHRQDYFFINYAYQGDYGALSYKYDNRITVHEGECYIGQPYAGYAPNGQSDDEMIIIGVLIQTDTFFRSFLHVLAADQKLFRFFLNPQINEYSDEFIHLKFGDTFFVRQLLELMVIEYGNSNETSQEVLKSLTLALLMQVARQYKLSFSEQPDSLADKIVHYMLAHIDTVTLGTIAQEFSYHPNYISSFIHKELGKSFSEILLEQRMERAVALLKGTNLSIEEIATMLGYSNSSNFYKAFRGYYHTSPREYIINSFLHKVSGVNGASLP